MVELQKVKNGLVRTNQSVDIFCEIKRYLKTEEKFKFVDEYKELLNNHINEHEGFESYVGFVFFNLLVIKYYTNIEIKLTYEEFDILQENGIFNKIVEYIGDDYRLLLNFINMENNR